MEPPPHKKNGHHYPIKHRPSNGKNSDELIIIRKNDRKSVHDIIRDRNKEKQLKDEEKKIETLSKAIDAMTNDPENLAIFEKALKKSKLSKSQLFASALNFRARDRILDAIWRDKNRITVQDPENGVNSRVTIGQDGNGDIRVVFYDRNGGQVKVREHRLAYQDERETYFEEKERSLRDED
tara:strand:- start:36955 stop:37497 length:543 start_codon:yes stop_codon:yes gene_type:complete